MKFTPLKFQGALAAGGVALMPFVYLQYAVTHANGLVALSDIPLTGIGWAEAIFNFFLLGIMALFTAIHFILTVSFIRSLVPWLFRKEEYHKFINNPMSNIGIFSPIISLAMSMNVILGPFTFFFPKLSANIQVMMWPSLIVFGILWVILFRFLIKVYTIWLSKPVEAKMINFAWLLDVFALGMVSLAGTGIASMAKNETIASLVGFMSLVTLSFGFLLFISKLIYLIYHQIRSDQLPDKQLLPTFLVVIPISCLFGVSLFKFFVYLENQFSFNVKVLSYFVVTFSFVTAVGWGIFSLYLLSSYFKKEFVKNEFYPGQWTIVCAFVGSEVLASYVYGNFYKSSLFLIFNSASILFASIVYVLVLVRYNRANSGDKVNQAPLNKLAKDVG